MRNYLVIIFSFLFLFSCNQKIGNLHVKKIVQNLTEKKQIDKNPLILLNGKDLIHYNELNQEQKQATIQNFIFLDKNSTFAQENWDSEILLINGGKESQYLDAPLLKLVYIVDGKERSQSFFDQFCY